MERLQSGHLSTPATPPVGEIEVLLGLEDSPRIQQLKRIIKQLTTNIANSSSTPYICRIKLLQLLQDASISENNDSPEQSAYEKELEWLLLGKATILVYGIAFRTLLDQTLPLSEDLFYWDEVLGSYRYTALYCVQTAPSRLLESTKDVYHDAMGRFRRLRELHAQSIESRQSETMSESLQNFYSLVRSSIRDRAEVLHRQILMTSPLGIVRKEVRKKRASVKRLREMQASSLGILIGDTLTFDLLDFNNPTREWKLVIEQAALRIKMILCNVSSVKSFTVGGFEEHILNETAKPSQVTTPQTSTSQLSTRLQKILQLDVPHQVKAARRVISAHGRPSILVRYWAPATAILFTSSRILSLLTRRKADLRVWVSETATIIVDFWENWVIDPLKKILGTIRHDEASEVALMSRRSLNADMESLERMVVDFAIDNPQVSAEAASLTTQELEMIRQGVKEGDLTPVLKAYEKALRSPFKAAVKGELVRALLIQIQKTKVDVEIAISGIDRLLKSQELVFGLVGLTPGLLTTWGLARWLAGVMGGRQGTQRGKSSEDMLKVLK